MQDHFVFGLIEGMIIGALGALAFMRVFRGR